jgi:CBS domain-containing protein
MLKTTVRRFMTTPVISVSPETRLPEALDLMKDRNIRRLPVVLATGTLVGIVTRVDLNEALPPGYEQMTSWASIEYARRLMTIGEVMTASPVTTTPDNSLHAAVDLMLKHRISGLPVVEDGRVIGLITDSDIFRAFVRQEVDAAPSGKAAAKPASARRKPVKRPAAKKAAAKKPGTRRKTGSKPAKRS